MTTSQTFLSIDSSSESNIIVDSAPLSELSFIDESDSGIEYESEHVLPQPKQWKALTPSGFGIQPWAECNCEPLPPHLPEYRSAVESASLTPSGFTMRPSAALAGKSSKFSEAVQKLCGQLEDLHDREVRMLMEENTRLRAGIQLQSGQIRRLSSQRGSLASNLGNHRPIGKLSSSERGSLTSLNSKIRQGGSLAERSRASKKTQSTSSLRQRFVSKGGQSTTSLFRRFQLLDQWEIDDTELEGFASEGNFEKESSLRPSFELRSSTDVSSKYSLLQGNVPLHPEHRFRLAWDLTAALLLAYDTVMLPLYLFEVKAGGATKVMDWLTAIFWTLDIPASLCTGVFVKGRLEMSYGIVRKQYIRTWMVPDFVLVLTEWVLILSVGLGGPDALSSVGAIRNMRTLRFVRLVRLVKFELLITQLTRRINSVYLLLSFRIIKMVLAILVANHILASTWYAIGVTGWVEEQDIDTRDVLYCYLTSYHWSLTQFHGSMEVAPSTANERFFAVLVLLSALVAFSWFLSSMTNSMIMLQNMHQERTAQQRSMLGFLNQRHVSKALAVRIKEYITSFEKENPAVIQEKEVALFKVLPKSLMTDLHAEIRGRRFVQHPLFDHIYEKNATFLRQMLHESVEEVYANRNDVIFCTSEACSRMLFVNSKMDYALGQVKRITAAETERSTRTLKSAFGFEVDAQAPDSIFDTPAWLSEPVLWTFWVNCGMLTALEDACMYALQAKAFLKQIVFYKEVRLYATVYAKEFIQHLHELSDGALSDLPVCVDVHQVWDNCNQKVQRMLSIRSASRASDVNPAGSRSRASQFLATAMGRVSVSGSSANSGLFRR